MVKINASRARASPAHAWARLRALSLPTLPTSAAGGPALAALTQTRNGERILEEGDSPDRSRIRVGFGRCRGAVGLLRIGRRRVRR